MVDLPDGWRKKNFQDLVDENVYARFVARLRARAESGVANPHDPYSGAGHNAMERLLIAALRAEVRLGRHEYTDIHLLPCGERVNLARFETGSNLSRPLIVEHQMIAAGRYDNTDEPRSVFVIWTGDGLHPPRGLDVECVDGDKGEPAAEPAIGDRSRDRDALEAGHALLRLTKSEIHRDPIGCALRILDWAVEEAFG